MASSLTTPLAHPDIASRKEIARPRWYSNILGLILACGSGLLLMGLLAAPTTRAQMLCKTLRCTVGSTLLSKPQGNSAPRITSPLSTTAPPSGPSTTTTTSVTAAGAHSNTGDTDKKARGTDWASWLFSSISALAGCGLTVFGVRKYGLQLWLALEWWTFPSEFQQNASAAGLYFRTYFILTMNGITSATDLVFTAGEQLDTLNNKLAVEEQIEPLQLNKLKKWRSACEPAVLKATTYKFAPGLVDLFDYYDPRKRAAGGTYTILLIGQTGKGKTAILNFFAALNMVVGDTSDDALTRFKNKSEAQEAPKAKMESMTNYCTLYTIRIGPMTLSIIDSPGFGDTRGHAKNVEHEAKIMSALAHFGHVNCILVLSDSRLAPEMEVALRTVGSIMPRGATDAFAFICTNFVSQENKAFEDSPLPDLFPSRWQPKEFCIDNPHSLLSKKCPNHVRVDGYELIRGLSAETHVRAGLSVFVELLDFIKMFNGMTTTRFVRMEEKKAAVEKAISDKVTAVEELAEQVRHVQRKVNSRISRETFFPRCSCSRCGWCKRTWFGYPECQFGDS